MGRIFGGMLLESDLSGISVDLDDACGIELAFFQVAPPVSTRNRWHQAPGYLFGIWEHQLDFSKDIANFGFLSHQKALEFVRENGFLCIAQTAAQAKQNERKNKKLMPFEILFHSTSFQILIFF